MRSFTCILMMGLMWSTQPSALAQTSPADEVNMFIGSSNSRWMMFPGPTRPFGMVKYSPDNQANVWNGGYEYANQSISGFSHIHSWSMGGLSLMPTTGNLRTWPGPADGPFGSMWTAGYRSRFDRNTEKAGIGFYEVTLQDYNIRVALASTQRCGLMRLTYPKTNQANLLLHFSFAYEENRPVLDSAVYRWVSPCEVEGYTVQRSSFADAYKVHFVLRFSKDMAGMRGWQVADSPAVAYDLFGKDWQRPVHFFTEKEQRLTGDCGLALQWETGGSEDIFVQSAISLVSVAQARLNLNTEMAGFGFDYAAVVADARNEWNQLLGKVVVKGGTKAQRQQFYTNLYRAYAGRTRWNDVNGKYVDMCEQEQQLPPGVPAIYGCDALWGAHWNLFPLWTLLTPGTANEWVQSLLEMYEKGGWLPQGPEGIEYAEVMVAAHQIKLIVSAYQKGIRGYDAEKAWEAIWKHQQTPGQKHPCGGWVGHKNLDSYLRHGYVANEDGPVSNTLEIAFDDWAAAQLALALGKKEAYRELMQRSENFRNIFDSSTGFMRQRHADGRWVKDWDPYHNHGTWFGAGYVEGTAWHYSFYVPHNLPALIGLVGQKRFVERLEDGFSQNHIDIGNQPNMQAPFLFNYAGRPDLTQRYVHQVLAQQFDHTPWKGYPGEEDQGQLGAWYVLAAMGLFQMDGGCSAESWYDLTTPLFDEITLQLDDAYYSGKQLTMRCRRSTPEARYIQSIHLNGKPVHGFRIAHRDLVQGGLLEYTLDTIPKRQP